MKPLLPSLVEALESQEYRQAILFSLDVNYFHFRFTSWSQSIFHGGYEYIPRGMVFNDLAQSSSAIVDTLSLDLDDVNRELIDELGDLKVEAFPVVVTYVIVDSIGQEVFDLVYFDGFLDHWAYVPGKIMLTAASILLQHQRSTTSTFSGSCRWVVFKGPYCKYTGSGTECDRSYSQCEANQNEVNFGGFRWLPSMVTKKFIV